MKVIKGKHSTIKIFTDNIEDVAVKQIKNLSNHEMTRGATVRIMPDVHAGAGSTIGTVIKLPEKFEDWKVSPNIVGVDIDCGVLMYKLKDEDVDLKKIDGVIDKYIPTGFHIHDKPKDLEFTTNILNKLSFNMNKEEKDRVHNSLGTLGGGNHFIELGLDEDKNYWLSVHSGSRGLGVHVAKHHQNIAIEELVKKNTVDINSIVTEMKAEGRHKEIQGVIEEIKQKNKELTSEQKQMATLEGDLLKIYMIDMELAQEYGRQNRQTMLDTIVNHMGFEVVDKFDSEHNFIEHDNFTNGYVRKGATSAKKGERLVIPLNMRDGSLITKGKGNEDWAYSAPHGAGRLMSRKKAKENLKLEDFQEQMKNVYSSSVVEETLDEAPDAYKPAQEIMGYIKDAVEVLSLVTPVYNYKGV